MFPEQWVSTEQDDWAAQADDKPLLILSFLPTSIIFIHDHVLLSVHSIYLGCLFFYSCSNVPTWITCATPTPMHEKHHMNRWGGGVKLPPITAASHKLVLFFYNYLRRRRCFTVGWFCCPEGAVAAQWLCVFVDSHCVGKWTCWICKWLLVSYHKNNSKRIKWEKRTNLGHVLFFMWMF